MVVSHPSIAPTVFPPEAPKRPVTIKDIAKIAGVHFTTVSLALRNHPSLPEQTKIRIKDIAVKLGYVPNAVFSALTHFHLHGRIRAEAPRIAYIVNTPIESGREHSKSQCQILDGARAQAKALGYELEIVVMGEISVATLESHLHARNITGLVIAAFDPCFDTITLNWENYCIVKIDSMHMAPPAPVVGSDHRQDVRLAFQRLRALGYQRIGLAIGRADEDATERLYTAGYLLEQGAISAEDRIPELIFPYQCATDQASDLLREWTKRHRVEAVICNQPNAPALLRDAGLRVPQDITCASLCLLERNSRQAGVCPNPRTIGAKAIDLVAALLKSGERGIPEYASRTYVKSYWQDGETVPEKN